MRESYSRLYVHLVWGTWDRLPLITPEIRVPVYQSIHEQASHAGCELIAVGGIEDTCTCCSGSRPPSASRISRSR
jgi:putative transposase